MRQWSSFHPEFTFLPRKFKIAVIAAKRPRRDALARYRHSPVRNDEGGDRRALLVGGGHGPHADDRADDPRLCAARSPASPIRGILRVYNRSVAATTSTRRASRSSSMKTRSASTHEQNLVLPHVALADLEPLYRALLTDGLGDSQCGPDHRYHRLPGARLLRAGQCALDPRGAGRISNRFGESQTAGRRSAI
jgi:sulfite reductase beta subunit-like hemoprotein